MILATLCYVKRESGMGLSSGRTAFRRPMAENGRLDVAYDLLTQKTIPSWLYVVTKGATIIWQRWEGIDESGKPSLSLNHYSPGAVIQFLDCKVAGIEALEPGYRCISIHPVPGGGLTSAKATYESVYGLIVSEWVKENGRMSVNITIPVNTQAMVVLPGAIVSQVMECGIPLSQKQGIATPKQTGTDAQVAIGSGVYHFEYPIA